VDGGSYYLPI